MKRFLVPGLGRRLGVVVAVVTLVSHIGTLLFAGWALSNVSVVRDWLVVGKVAESARLDEYVETVGLSASGRFYLFAAHPTLHTPETFDEACPVREAGIAVLGCYTESDDTIHLLDITDDTLTTLEPVVAAHEALHAIWARFDARERSVVATEVEKSFTHVSDLTLLGRLAPYESMSPDERDAELFAILGTESPTVTPALEDIYSRYFDDRQKCVDLAASSANIIADISNAIESVGTQIVTVEATIAADLVAYKKERKKLIRDINAFNSRANDPGSFASSSVFSRERNALERRQRQLEKTRVSINAAIEQYNTLVEQMSVLNAQATSLNTALGIDASAMVAVPTEP